ncbi:hypothetical protein MRB53_030159 [Persea americana]|uniref:Uncharacterized protein n=1 Tax=Persea americana TaxID=3435 RepID=A0ACC2KKI2_PERAE|nr:hypothetical protein MRB53_030159 [Persea americana]
MAQYCRLRSTTIEKPQWGQQQDRQPSPATATRRSANDALLLFSALSARGKAIVNNLYSSLLPQRRHNLEIRTRSSSTGLLPSSSLVHASRSIRPSCERERSTSLREGEMGLEGRAVSSLAMSRLAVERGRDEGRETEIAFLSWQWREEDVGFSTGERDEAGGESSVFFGDV